MTSLELKLWNSLPPSMQRCAKDNFWATADKGNSCATVYKSNIWVTCESDTTCSHEQHSKRNWITANPQFLAYLSCPSQISYGLHISLHRGSGVHDPKQLFRGRDIELGNALHANLLRLQCDHEAHTDTMAIRGMSYTRSLQIPSLQL